MTDEICKTYPPSLSGIERAPDLKFKTRQNVWYGEILAETFGVLGKNDDGQYIYFIDIFPARINNSNFLKVAENELREVKEGEI